MADGKVKVLYLEDDAPVANLYARALERAGYEVTIEHDGAKGLGLAGSDVYAIVLLDLALPSMSGLEILRELHNHKPPIKCKIVITTNLEQSGKTKDEIDKQADGYLVKADTTPNQLVDFLSHIEIKT